MVCWTGGEKGINKKEPPLVQIAKKTNAKTFPPESEVRNIQSSGKNTEQNRNKNRKASETIIDTNDRER